MFTNLKSWYFCLVGQDAKILKINGFSIRMIISISKNSFAITMDAMSIHKGIVMNIMLLILVKVLGIK